MCPKRGTIARLHLCTVHTRIAFFMELVIWAESGECSKQWANDTAHALALWRSRMLALLVGGKLSDLDGVSENVCCFQAESVLVAVARGRHKDGMQGTDTSVVDLELGAMLSHAKSSKWPVHQFTATYNEACCLVANGQCSAFETARWASSTGMLLGIYVAPATQRPQVGPVCALGCDLQTTERCIRSFVRGRIEIWDGPRLRTKLTSAFSKRDTRADEAAEAALFSRDSLERRGSRRDKSTGDNAEEFIHATDLSLLLNAAHLGPAGLSLRTLVEMKILHDELEVRTGMNFMGTSVGLQSNRTDRGSDAVWAATCFIREEATGFVCLLRKHAKHATTPQSVPVPHWVWSHTLGPTPTPVSFATAFVLWYLTERSTSNDPLRLRQLLCASNEGL
jgi:hypothetical protein